MHDNGSVSYLIRRIPRGPRPERADEHVHVARASRGDREAVEILVSSHVSYVVHMAKEFRGRGVPFEDLIADGCVGLLKAIRRYRSGNGTRFMTYASFWVRKEILAAVTDRPHTVHVTQYGRRQGRDTVRVLQLDAPMSSESGLRLADRLRHPDALATETIVEDEATRRVRRHVLRLTPRDQAVIAARFGLGDQPQQTLSQIAGRFGLSKERVRQIEASALTRLRHAMNKQNARRDRSAAPPSALAGSS